MATSLLTPSGDSFNSVRYPRAAGTNATLAQASQQSATTDQSPPISTPPTSTPPVNNTTPTPAPAPTPSPITSDPAPPVSNATPTPTPAPTPSPITSDPAPPAVNPSTSGMADTSGITDTSGMADTSGITDTTATNTTATNTTATNTTATNTTATNTTATNTTSGSPSQSALQSWFDSFLQGSMAAIAKPGSIAPKNTQNPKLASVRRQPAPSPRTPAQANLGADHNCGQPGQGHPEQGQLGQGLLGHHGAQPPQGSQATGGDRPGILAGRGPVLVRCFDQLTGEHLYTGNDKERQAWAQDPRFRVEGGAFRAEGPDVVQRYRQVATGAHVYAIDPIECDTIRKSGQYELESTFAASRRPMGQLVPVFRFFKLDTQQHFYTAQPAERDQVLKTMPNCRDEGVAFYAASI